MKRILLNILFVIGIASLGLAQSQIGNHIVGSDHNDNAGQSVAISGGGDTVAVSIPKNQNSTKGFVQVFYKKNGTWTQIGSDITKSSPSNHWFGTDLDISSNGKTIVISNTRSTLFAEVWHLVSGNWVQKGSTISAPNGGWFGETVSISGDGSVIAVAAPYESSSGTSDEEGSVRVYSWNGFNYAQLGNAIFGDDDDAQFGRSVSLSKDGKRIAIGATHHEGGTVFGGARGQTRIFDYNNSTNQWQATVGSTKIINGEADGDQSGFSVSLSGNGERVAISSIVNTGGVAWNRGHVRVFEHDNTYGWQQIGPDLNGDKSQSRFGHAVSLSFGGNYLAVGARGDKLARIFKYNGSNYAQVGLDIEANPNYENWFGYSIDLAQMAKSSPYVLVGDILYKQPHPTQPWNDIYVGGAVAYDFTPVPEIEVKSNSTLIESGSATTSFTNNTNFGSVQKSAKLSKTYTIHNLGGEVLSLTASPFVSLTGSGDFNVTTQPSSSSIASLSSRTFTIEFEPSSAVRRTAVVKIETDDADESEYTFLIEGTGIESPEMIIYGNNTEISDNDLTPNSSDHTDFGNCNPFAGSVSRTFTIENTGSANLNFTGTAIVAVSGTNANEFSVTSQPSSSTLNASASTTFTVVFDPSSPGTKNATLSIANNDADENPYNFNITGFGTRNQATGAAVLNVNGPITVNSGVTLRTHHLVMTENANVQNDGTILVSGNWENDQNSTMSGSGLYDVKGSDEQEVSPNNATIARMRVENNQNVVLLSSGSVNELTLNGGNVELGDNDLTLTGTITGGASNSYIRITGTGRVNRTVSASATTIPVGRNPYLPVTIENGGGREYSIGVFENIYSDPTNPSSQNLLSSNVIGETWSVQSDGVANNVIVTVQWEGTEEETGFTRASSYLAYWENGISTEWNSGSAMSASGSDPYTLTRTMNFSTNLYYFGVGSSGSPLPVEFTYFNVKWLKEGETAVLDWQTALEENNSHFEIQRSLSGVEGSWEQIGRVEGQGTTFDITDYQFIDNGLPITNNNSPITIYYRLKQIDYNGAFDYSEIKTLNLEPSTINLFKVWPNPVNSSFINLSLVDDYDLITTEGIVIKRVLQTNRINISNLAEGAYMIRNKEGLIKTFIKY
ncbi:MAG: choice-of-anchor D domain-containing protein [Bacteroidia bacterium]